MANLILTSKEQKFLESLLGSIDPSNPVYLEMAERYLSTYLNDSTKLVTDNAREIIETLHYKVSSAIMDENIEDILAEQEPIIPKKNTTKAKSLKLTKANLHEKQMLVYCAISTAGLPLSRSDIANRTDLRLSSVCARVRELIDAGLIRVCGTKWDTESERNVETLEVV